MVLKNIQLPEASVVTFLSTSENLKWQNEGNDVIISMPDYDPNKIKAPYAYVLKISNYGKYAHKPVMIVSYPNGSMTPEISFDKNFTGEIHYTIDGSEPLPDRINRTGTNNSNLYSKPFSVKNTSIVKAIAILPNALPSNVSSGEVKVYHWMKGEKVKNPKSGIAWKYYEPEGEITLESIQTSPVKKEGIANAISEKVKQREEKYALQFDGYIKIDKDGVYHFSTISDDGSKLFIDGEEVVNNDGEHGTLEAFGDAALKKGFHKIKVTYFDGGGVNDLKAFWQKGNGEKEEIPGSVLFH